MGISVTTLEEVFLQATLCGTKVTESDVDEATGPTGPAPTTLNPAVMLEGGESLEMHSSSDLSTKLLMDSEGGQHTASVHPSASFLQQTGAVIDKNLIVIRRNPTFFILMVMVPLFFMVFGATYEIAAVDFNPLASAPAFELNPTGTVLLESGSAGCTTGLCAYAKNTYLRDKRLSTQVVSNVSEYVGNIS
jgi:hypothetical protein